MNDQLDLFASPPSGSSAPSASTAERPAAERTIISTAPLQGLAQALLRQIGCCALAQEVRVLWNPRMRSTAGVAYPGKALILLNPRLHAFEGELERTLRHELAHLLAHARAGRKRISAHGPEWRQACADLGAKGETRCHQLPLPKRKMVRKYAYACPACATTLHRVRPLRKKSACLPCCRAHNGGRYHDRFQLRRVEEP